MKTNFYNYKTYKKYINAKPSCKRNAQLNRLVYVLYKQLIDKYSLERFCEYATYSQIHMKRKKQQKYIELKKDIKKYKRTKKLQKICRERYLNDPRHRNLNYILAYFNPDPNTGKISRNEYETTNGYKFGRMLSKSYYVHRLVWMFVHGWIPKELEINHKDGNKQNNKISNLELLTNKENVNYSIDNGLRKLLTFEQRKENARRCMKKWQRENKDKILEYNRNRYWKNPEKARAYFRSLYNKNNSKRRS